MMETKKISIDEMSRIGLFVSRLSMIEREIAKAYVKVQNTPDCQPEILSLHAKYGENFKTLSDKIEGLRQKIGCDYNALQQELKWLI